LAAAALTGTLVLAGMARGADNNDPAQKPATNPAPFYPPAPPAPSVPPASNNGKVPATVQGNGSQQKGAVPNLTAGQKPSPYLVNPMSKTAPSGTKHGPELSKSPAGTPNSVVRPVQPPSPIVRTTFQPPPHATPLSRPSAPVAPGISSTSKSSSPSLRDRLRNLFR
jgi:hypothetical protein